MIKPRVTNPQGSIYHCKSENTHGWGATEISAYNDWLTKVGSGIKADHITAREKKNRFRPIKARIKLSGRWWMCENPVAGNFVGFGETVGEAYIDWINSVDAAVRKGHYIAKKRMEAMRILEMWVC